MMGLPEELLCEIMCHLPHEDLGRFSQACRDFYRIGSEDKLWKKKGFLKRKISETSFAGQVDSPVPTPRLCHTAVSHKNKMYVFGGHNTEADSQRFSEVRSDLFSLDFESQKWEKLTIQEMPQKTEHSTVIHDGKLYTFGGYSGHTFSNTMFMINLSTSSQCVQVKPKGRGEVPTGRSAHVGVVYDDKYYMFGGWDGVVQNNDFYSFDFEKSEWNKIESPNAPHKRCSHTAAISNTRKSMYIFGGFGGKTRNYLSDLWSFNFETRTWTEMIAKGDIPSPRSRMKMLEYNDKLYVFGGWDKVNHFDQLYEYDIEKSTWTRVDLGPEDDAFKIGQFSMSIHDNILYVFGGYSSKEKKSTNDLFCLRLGRSSSSTERRVHLESKRPEKKYQKSDYSFVPENQCL